MTLKNTIQADQVPVNKYKLLVLGLPEIIFTFVSGLEDETEVTEMPDRTSVSNGQSKPFDLTVRVPLHHTAEIAAMELWLQEGRDPVTATYKKAGTLIYKTVSDTVAKTYSLLGAWVTKQKVHDAEMSNDTDHAEMEFTIRVDQKLPI